MVCVAVLLASYGVGLGVRKARFSAAEKKAQEEEAAEAALRATLE